MISLAIGVAVLDGHTGLTRLETNTLSCHAAAVGTAFGRRIAMMVHGVDVADCFGLSVRLSSEGANLNMHRARTTEREEGLNNNSSITDDDINDENDGPSRAFGIRRGISDPLLTS